MVNLLRTEVKQRAVMILWQPGIRGPFAIKVLIFNGWRPTLTPLRIFTMVPSVPH